MTERLFRGSSGRISVVLALSVFVINIGRNLFSPLLSEVASGLGVTSAKIGFSLTVLWIGWAISQYPSGRLSDQLSRSTVLVPSLFILNLGYFTIIVFKEYIIFLLGVFLIGVGSGSFIISSRAVLSDLFVERRGQAFGLNQAAGRVGGICSGLLATAIIIVSNWRVGFGLVFLTSILVAIGVHNWRHDPYSLSSFSLGLKNTFMRVWSLSQIRYLAVAYSLYMFSLQGFLAFLPTYLRIGKEISPAIASSSYTVLFIAGAVSLPISGILSDYFSRLSVVIGSLILLIFSIFFLIISYSTIYIIISLTFVAMGFWSFSPALQSHLMDEFSDQNLGGDFGAFRTVYFFIGSLGPTFVGFIADQTSYFVAFSSIAVLIFCCFISIGTTMLRLN